MDYISKSHSKFLIMVHLIFVCKYRKKLLVKFAEQIKTLMLDIAQEKKFRIIEIETDNDHLHLLVSYNPNQSILQIVRHLKQISTYRIWRIGDNNLYLQKHFWKEKTFCSDGYFACSIGNVSNDVIKKYIQSQG